MISHVIRTAILATICAASVPDLAGARTIYDGEWSVLIVTERGVCDRAYRYGVQIIDGIVSSQGSGAINFTGRVANDGRVQVSVAAGDKQASGRGRLSRTTGQGSWTGVSQSSGA